MGVNIDWSRAGFNAIRNSPEMQGALLNIAEGIAAKARASAPVDTGEYRDSITADVQPGATRAHARVTASARHAMKLESETGNLKRALG